MPSRPPPPSASSPRPLRDPSDRLTINDVLVHCPTCGGQAVKTHYDSIRPTGRYKVTIVTCRTHKRAKRIRGVATEITGCPIHKTEEEMPTITPEDKKLLRQVGVANVAFEAGINYKTAYAICSGRPGSQEKIDLTQQALRKALSERDEATREVGALTRKVEELKAGRYGAMDGLCQQRDELIEQNRKLREQNYELKAELTGESRDLKFEHYNLLENTLAGLRKMSLEERRDILTLSVRLDEVDVLRSKLECPF